MIMEKIPWRIDSDLFDSAGKNILHRRFENYAIFKLGEVLASKEGIDIAFNSPINFPDAILVDLEHEKIARVEFEEFSSEFKRHGHDPSRCDLIICVIDDWNEKYTNEKCPLPIWAIG